MLALTIATALAIAPASLDPAKPVLLAVPVPVARTAPRGTEVVRLVISPEGTVVSCDARIVGRGPVVDEQNCRKASTLVATPARDADGATVYGEVAINLDWSLMRDPAKAPAVIAPSVVTDFRLPVKRLPSSVTADPVVKLAVLTRLDGSLEQCAVLQGSGNAPLDKAACGALKAAGLEPLRDAAKTAVRGVRMVTVGFVLTP